MFTFYLFTSRLTFAKIDALLCEVSDLNNFRRKATTFFLRNRDKGIRNLMLYVAIGNVIVYLFSIIDRSGLLLDALSFSPTAIRQGQIWRLFTVMFLDVSTSSYRLLSAIFMVSYYWVGRIIEQSWGTLKFNVYYFLGLLICDLAALLGGCAFLPGWYHMTLFLIFAIVMPNAQVRIWGILPLRAKYLAWFDIGFTLFDCIRSLVSLRGMLWLPSLTMQILLPLIPIVYCLLFAGRDAALLLPDFLRYRKTETQKNFRRYQNQGRRTGSAAQQRPNPGWANNYQSPTGEKPYRHKCTVCGRTDVSNPELEFRYCSKCNGYYCYCMDHINNHVHIQ